MKPSQVLDTLALLKDRMTSPMYQAYMQPFMEDVARKQSGPVIMDPVGKPSGFHFCQREVKRLEQAEAYFVSKDMVSVAEWASQSLDESDSFRHDLWPTDYGFLWLDEAHVGTELWGRTVTTCAMSWGRSVVRGHPGTLVVLYTDMDDERDEVNASVKAKAVEAGEWKKYQQMGRLHVHHIMWLEDGRGVGPAETVVPQDHYQQFIPTEEEALLTGASRVMAKTASNDARFMLALLMLFNQTIASVTEADIDRQTQKRMRRMNMPARVTVVALRRTEGSRKEGESLVEWQHRWVVRGHWRWQAYGKRDDSHTHEMGEVFSEAGRMVRLCERAGCDRHWERIYVAPFIKGPESAPFKQSTKVYSLQR